VLLAGGGHIRIQAHGDLANPLPGALHVLNVVVIAGTLVSWTAWLAIQIPAYRHARGEYRQQLKWLYSGAGIWVLSLIFGVFIAQLIAGNAPGWGNQAVVGAIVLLGTAALPVCMGVAVLKYRLYELNRVISRVVSYTVITALLGGLFAGLILLATHVLPVKGSADVAVATLVIAALFNPLRRRVQRAVDRRFNRARHDAEAIRDRVHRATSPDHRPGRAAGRSDRRRRCGVPARPRVGVAPQRRTAGHRPTSCPFDSRARPGKLAAGGSRHSGLGSQRNRLIATKPPATPQIARTSSWWPANPRSRANGFSRAWLNGRTGNTPARSLRKRLVIWK